MTLLVSPVTNNSALSRASFTWMVTFDVVLLFKWKSLIHFISYQVGGNEEKHFANHFSDDTWFLGSRQTS